MISASAVRGKNSKNVTAPKVKLRYNRNMKRASSGFSLIELLIVIAIIGVLSTVVLRAIHTARDRAYFTRAREELNTMAKALELYAIDHGGDYPADVSRDVPPGIGAYISGNQATTWPDAPWPGSIYDWENWVDPVTGKPIYQVSIRFCPAGGPLSACQFPNETWATGFQIDSSYYYCVQGACRAHINQPTTYPGKCANC
jgi:prepilin-type N-terminal cleavage/methylation domain-containing protein